MATYLENLVTRRNNIAAELAALTSTAAGGKPNSGKGGIGHTEYRDSLVNELKELNKMISDAGGDTTEEGSEEVFELDSQVEL